MKFLVTVVIGNLDQRFSSFNTPLSLLSSSNLVTKEIEFPCQRTGLDIGMLVRNACYDLLEKHKIYEDRERNVRSVLLSVSVTPIK